jgi:GAF domain-containing protein
MVQSVSPRSSGAGAVSPLVALQATLQQMREQTDAKALIQLTLEYVKAVFGAPLIWLALYDPANHQLVGQGGVTLREEDRPLLQAAYPLQPGEILEQVVFEQRPISVPDLSQEPRMGLWQREAKRLGGIQGCFIYPFSTVGRRRCLGILMLGSQLWGATTHEEEKALLGILLGQLAASLQKLEDAWKRQAEKRFEESLLRLGAAMCRAGSLQERVSLVTQELQSCLGTVHIQVYWHKPREGRFVPHESAARPTPAPTARGTKAGVIPMGEGSLALRELGNLYSSLAAGQVVVGDLETTRAEVPLKLMQQWRAQSALAAPIRLQQELLGFIWVQSEVPRTWQAAERQLVAAAAHGLALATPLENLDRRLRQLADDQEFVHQVGQALSNPAQLQQALQQAVVGLGQRLQAAAVAVLTLDPNQPIPRLFYEYRSEGQQALPQQFSSLSEQDWQDLLRSEVVVAENYDQDLRLLSWRQELAPLGVRSLMLTHTEVGGSATPAALPQGLILVLHPQRRAWSREERQLLRGIAQPVGLILRQIQLEQRRQRQEQLFNGLVAACLTLQNLTTLPELYAATVQQTAQALGIPLALVVSWQPGESRARLQPPFAAAPAFYPTGPTEIDRQDPLLTRALQARGPLQLSQDQIPAASRTWLNSTGLGSWLLLPLGEGGPETGDSPGLEPLGVLILGAEADKVWEPEEQAAATVIAQTCGWTLRRLLWVQTLQERQEVLSELNWYKHRRLLDLQSALLDSLRRLGQVPATPGDEATRWQKVVEIARGLRDLAASVEPLLQAETWQAQPQLQSLSVATLVRKSLRRLEGLAQKRKLWPRAHGDLSLTVWGDPGRLEMVLWEVLVAAALRSPEGGRLDLWSRVAVGESGAEHSGYAELLVVDQGRFDPHLLAALQGDPRQVVSADPLFQSPLAASPGLELSLCQRIVQRLGGQLSFYLSSDGRSVSQLLLPLSLGRQSSQQPKQGQEGQRSSI